MSKRSGIPVASKSSIPVVRKSANTTTPSIVQSTNVSRSSSMTGKRAPASKTPAAAPRKSNTDLPKDPKLLKEMIVNLQKQLQERDQTLIEMNQKLAMKSEECDNLMEERDMLRNKNSFDLQQITGDYASIQDQLKAKEHWIQEMENAHAEEKMELRLELEISRSEHQLEVEFLKKELEAAKEEQNGNKDNKTVAENSDLNVSQEWLRDDTDFAAQQNKYEEELRLLREQLQEQIAIANAAVEKLEQQEFNFHEKMNAYKNKLELEKEALVNESRQNVEVLRDSYEEKLQLQEEKYSEEINSLKISQNNKIIDRDEESTEAEIKQKMNSQYVALKAEHETYMAALKEEYEDELRTIQQQIQQREEEYVEKESRMAEDMVKLHNEFEKQFEDSKIIFENKIEEKQEALQQLQLKVSELEQELETNKDELKSKDVCRDQELITQLNEKTRELENVRTKNEKYEQDIFELKTQLEKEQSMLEEERNKIKTGEKESHPKKIQELKEQYGKEIQGLQDMIENLQEENNELKTEFDLVVGDLSSELENQRLNIPRAKRKNSSVLMDQIDKLRKDYQRETTLLSEELEETRTKNEELESELQILRTGKDQFTDNSKLEDLEENMTQFQKEKKEFENAKKNFEVMEEKYQVLEKERYDLKTTILEHRERLNENERLEKELRCKLERAETSLANKEKLLSLNEEKLEKLSESLAELKYIQGELEEENQRLKDENNDMKSKEIETAVAATEVQLLASEGTRYEESRPSSTTIEYEQRFAGVVEEYEAKVEALETELRCTSQKLSVKEKQVESINSETEVLRSSLEDETLNAQALEERLQTNKESYTNEVNILKEKLKNATFEKETVSADIEEHLGQKYLNTIESLKEELESSIKDNEKKNSELLQLRKFLEEHQENRRENEAVFHAENSQLIEDNESKAAKLEALSSENEHLHLEINRLAKNQSESEEKHKASELEFVETITLKTNEIANLEDQLQLLRAQFLQAEASYKACEISRSGESDSKVKELADLTSQLHSSEEQRLQDQATHRQEMERLKEINDSRNREVANLNKQLQKFQEQDMKRRAAFKAEKQQLEKEINLKCEEICCLKEEFKEKQLRKEADQIARQLNVNEHENSKNQEVQELQSHLQILQHEQKSYESKYIEEQNRLKEENNRRFEECTTLREQVRQLQEQLGASEAYKISEILKLKQEHLCTVEELENQLSSKKKEINELRNLLEDVKSLKSEYESKYSQEQEKRNREQAEKIRSLEDNLQVKSSEVAKLKSTLEDLKFQIRETKFIQTNEQLKEHEIHTVKVRDLETELEKKSIEISCLISMLESENKSHDRILKETERHLDQIEKTEEEKAHVRVQVGELKLEIQTLKADLEKERERCHQLTLEHSATKIDLGELEEVQKLNRSLNEFEFEKGKLFHELENTKIELKKAQEKYQKLKEKFFVLKGKLQEEQQRYEEKFLSPRVDSGLQTEILQLEEYERMKTESFDAECEKFRLAENLRSCEKELTKSKGEVSALKKANAVLIKQNQVLYLETESLRKGDISDTKRELEVLEKDKKELQIENEALRFSLKQKDRDFDRFDDELSKTESEDLHGRTENESKRMKEENAFLLNQNKKLHTQLEDMERELHLVRNHTAHTFNGNNTNFGNEQRPSTRDFVQHESVSPLMQAPLTGFPYNAALNTSTELQRVAEEQIRMKEQIEQLVAERENLTSEVRSLKEKSSTKYDKEHDRLNSYQVIERDKKNTQPQATQKVGRPNLESIQRFHNQMNLNEMDFRTDNYLSPSYWDAVSFLQAVREVNSAH